MKLLKEPLVHFAVGGAILFAAYALLDREQPATAGFEPVRIGEGEVRWLQETWTNQWLRKPSPQELQGLVADLVTEELLAREAREMGLEENDTIVRRRLAQKLKFLVEDTSRLVDPAEKELRQFYADNSTRFQSDARFTFSQLFFNPDQRKDATSDAKAVLHDLETARRRDPPAAVGDRLLVGADFQNIDEKVVTSLFGPEFTQAVLALPAGKWSGPVTSGYGVHLVSLADVTPAKLRPFEEVREEVLADWRREQEHEVNLRYLAQLREKFGVVFDDSVTTLLGSEPVASR